jgi:hypothetical protein
VSCRRCTSEKQQEFSVEMNVHFPGQNGLSRPSVMIFPQVVVCLDCGFAEFTVSETELPKLAKGRAAKVQ